MSLIRAGLLVSLCLALPLDLPAQDEAPAREAAADGGISAATPRGCFSPGRKPAGWIGATGRHVRPRGAQSEFLEYRIPIFSED